MPFESLCKNIIFQDVTDYEDIKVDKHVYKLLSSVFTGMGGRYTRLRIICAITETPQNMHELAKNLELDYKTVQHNISVLEKNSLIVRKGEGYGDVFFPADLLTSNLPTLYTVIRKVESKFDRTKKFIE